MGHGSHKQRAAEHKLVGDVPYVLVGGEVHNEGTHKTVVVGCHLPGGAVYVGEEFIPHPDGFLDSVVDGFAFLAELPNLAA